MYRPQPRCTHTSLVPRPHPLRGKRILVYMDIILGPGKGIWAFQSDRSSVKVMHVTIYHRNLEGPITMQVCSCYAIYWIAHTCVLTNQNTGLSRFYNKPHYKTPPRKASIFTRPLFPCRGWGLGTRLHAYMHCSASRDPPDKLAEYWRHPGPDE